MRCFTTQLVVWLTLLTGSLAFGQTSGTFWIACFSPEGTDFNDAAIDQKALARLDSLMAIPTISVTFYGADDSSAWRDYCAENRIENRDRLNTQRRLSRARALRERYGRGNIGVTRENVTGVKVVWTAQPEEVEQTLELAPIRIRNSDAKETAAVSRTIKPDIENEIRSTESENETEEK